jgi:hypothetical protein
LLARWLHDVPAFSGFQLDGVKIEVVDRSHAASQ